MTLKGEWKAHLIWLLPIILLIYPITDIFCNAGIGYRKEEREQSNFNWIPYWFRQLII